MWSSYAGWQNFWGIESSSGADALLTSAHAGFLQRRFVQLRIPPANLLILCLASYNVLRTLLAAWALCPRG
jgi:hypothetical protein